MTPLRSRRLAVALLLAGPLPLAAQADWRRDDTMPSRWQTPLCYDALHDQVLLFGGGEYSQYDDTWCWDGSRWVQQFPAHHPAGRQAHGMVYDPVQQRVLLYGGSGAQGSFNDLWTWTGSDWQQLVTAHVPPAAPPAGLAFDSLRNRLVMFGPGFGRRDFWEYDGTDWIDVTPSGVLPGSNSRPAMTFDPDSGLTILFEDADSRKLWTFDGTHAVLTNIAGFTLPFGFDLVHDPLHHRLISAGGYWFQGGGAPSYVFDSAHRTWTQLTAGGPVSNSWTAAYDSRRDRIVYLARPDVSGLSAGGTWEFDGSTWQRRAGDTPAPRTDEGMVDDGLRVVLYGGRLDGGNGTDTWQLQAGNWSLLVPAPSPPVSTHPGELVGMRMVRGFQAGESLLLGGGYGAALAQFRLINDQWQPLATSHAPTGRRDHAMVFDTRRQRVVLFGGQESSTLAYLDDTWVFDGSDWTRVQVPGAPPPRYGHVMAYDQRFDRVVMLGGLFNGGNPRDTWAFDGGTWQLRSTSLALPANFAPRLVYDGARQRTLLLNQSDAADRLLVFEWDGGDWQLRTTPHAPPASSQFQVAATSAGVELYGGLVGNVRSAQWWHLRSDHLATKEPFGSGCSNANGTPVLATDGALPWLGDAVVLRLSPLQSGPLVLPGLWCGFDRDQWQGVPLPIDLGLTGFPGCAVWIDPAAPWPIVNLGNGTAQARVAVPLLGALLGMPLYFQGYDFDPLAQTLSMSQGLRLEVGAR